MRKLVVLRAAKTDTENSAAWDHIHDEKIPEVLVRLADQLQMALDGQRAKAADKPASNGGKS